MNNCTVWEIGDTVYGVHVEVENRVYTIYVTKEQIVCSHEEGGWQSEGKINGVTVRSEMIIEAHNDRETAVRIADKLAIEAEEQGKATGAWDKVVKVYDD